MSVASLPEATSDNRRIAARRQPTVGTVCRLDLAAGPQSNHVGLVWNLSTSGVSMLLNEPLTPDSVVAAELMTMDERTALSVSLRIIHVRKIRTGDYFLGAQFDRPLAPEDIRPFLAELPPPG